MCASVCSTLNFHDGISFSAEFKLKNRKKWFIKVILCHYCCNGPKEMTFRIIWKLSASVRDVPLPVNFGFNKCQSPWKLSCTAIIVESKGSKGCWVLVQWYLSLGSEPGHWFMRPSCHLYNLLCYSFSTSVKAELSSCGNSSVEWPLIYIFKRWNVNGSL